MAVPTNTVTAHVAIGNREDLADIIYDISPLDTPFLSNVERVNATSVFHEWQTNSLEAAAANRQLEGDDADANTHNPTVRLGNYCQISRKVVSVSGTQNAVDTAGRDQEEAYQIVLRGREIKRDMEFALTRNQASSAGGAGTARSLASVESWLASNYVSVGTGEAQTTPGYSAGTVVAPTDSTIAGAFTEASLKSAIANCWSAGGDPNTIMVGSFNKRQASSAFGGIATQYRDNPGGSPGQATIIAAADVYVSDFGEHRIVPNRFSRDQTALVLDMEFWAVAELRSMETKPLGATGDNERTLLVTEYTLESRNEAASSKVADLTTS